MSRTIMFVLTGLSIVLLTGAVHAQQGMQADPQQPSSIQQGSQDTADTTAGTMGSPAVQRLSQALNQSDADLSRAIDTARDSSKGKVVGAAFFVPPSSAGRTTAQPGSTSDKQSRDLQAHVFVVANNQLKDVIVDTRNNKVLITEPRPMVSNPWSQREGMDSAMQPQDRSQGSTSWRDRTSSALSALRLDTAQRIIRYADQDNVTLQKAISTASSQAGSARIAGAFLVLGDQANVGSSGQPSTEGRDQQRNVLAKVFAVTNDQVKVMTVDVRNDKVINTETRQSFFSPWQGRMSGTDKSSSDSKIEQRDIQDRSTHGEDSWPTGSGSGTGPGSLGG
jgi:hypothetical protein